MDALTLAKQLIAIESITPHDNGCQTIIAEKISKLGFHIEHLAFGDVSNLWARLGTQLPLFVFAGHTDVVPTGPIEKWTSHPFEPTIRDGKLYGRGAADMKSSIAAMITAVEVFLQNHTHFNGSIAFLITSDEEGSAINGTAKVVELLKNKHEQITWCLVGEASSEAKLGDTVKVGRRGSLNGKLTIIGKQGHIAYPNIAINPIHNALPALLELTTTQWDQGTKNFQPTSFQISNIHAGTGADNVIPGQLEVLFNFRYSPAVSAEQLQQRVEEILAQHNLKYEISWRHSGLPFSTEPGGLVNAVAQAILEKTGITPKLSTSGGTSDGRFIATTGCQVLELGPINKSIHQIDEHINIQDLQNLTIIYQRILELLFANK